MTVARFLSRIRRTTWRQRLALAEAVILLALASLAIRLLPFRTLMAPLGRPARTDSNAKRRAERSIEARWAVRAAAPLLPWRIVCFQKGVALHLMLRRRGVASILHYGVAQSREEGVRAHVWVSAEGVDLIGGAEAREFTCLATFPAVPAL